MKRDAAQHLLGILTQLKPHTVVDLSVAAEKDTYLYSTLENPVIEGYSESLNGKVDCVICCNESQDVDEVLNQAKALLAPNGTFLFSTIAIRGITSKLKNLDFQIIEQSIDQSEPKHHNFVAKNTMAKENIVVLSNEENCSKSTPACTVKKCEAMPKCCRSHLYEMLNFVAEEFEKANIPYWIDLGTLLGAVREASLIPWDRNANIGFLRKDIQNLKKLSKTFTINGYSLTSQKDIFLLYYSRKNHLTLKLHPYNEAGGFLHNMQNYDKFPKDLIFPTGKLEFGMFGVGPSISCPAKPEKVLEIEYGYNWQTSHNSNGKVTTIRTTIKTKI